MVTAENVTSLDNLTHIQSDTLACWHQKEWRLVVLFSTTGKTW